MELRHLRYFVAVAEEENVTRAAQRLHVSQPAVSRQLRDVEEELGVPLFHRAAKTIRLTPAGRAFLAGARAVLERVEEAARAARSAAGRPAEELKIGYAPSPTVDLLATALRAFQREQPDVKLVLRDMTSCEMLEGLQRRRLHAALLVEPDRKLFKEVRFVELASYPVGIGLSPEHPWAKRRWIAPREVAHEPLVIYSRREYPDYSKWVSSVLKTAPRQWKIVEECDGAASLIAALEAGRGVAVVASSLLRMAGNRLRMVPLRPAPPPLRVGFACRSDDKHPPVLRLLESARQLAADQ